VRRMTVLSTKFDRMSVMALIGFIGYLLLPLFLS
jgi:hypothetical protein